MITLTASAKAKLRDSLSGRDNVIGIRLGVKGAGCSGYAYVFEFVEKRDLLDKVFTIDNITIFIDHKSFPLLDGSEVDYVVSGLSEGFEFNNPNAKNACGCGESFTV